MTYILFFWTIVASAGTQTSVYTERDWRPLGEFKSLAACQNAAHVLTLKSDRAICIPTDSVKAKQ